jgi:hypothetical protein
VRVTSAVDEVSRLYRRFQAAEVARFGWQQPLARPSGDDPSALLAPGGHGGRRRVVWQLAPLPANTLPLMRLRYGGSAARWGFAIYLASKDGYEVAALPTGDLAGLPEDSLDTACGLYLGDPTAWT